jgi:hypothetical protein
LPDALFRKSPNVISAVSVIRINSAAIYGLSMHACPLNGEIDLPGFPGPEPYGKMHMDKLPGFKMIRARVRIKSEADKKTVQELHDHVVKTSPVGITLSRPVNVQIALEVQ